MLYKLILRFLFFPPYNQMVQMYKVDKSISTSKAAFSFSVSRAVTLALNFPHDLEL